ncbi:MAG: hypothetical protein GXO89_16735, partial [Chlorobi bacterium]|nr:hypothetical protein [Chlorobiota bacterium]
LEEGKEIGLEEGKEIGLEEGKEIGLEEGRLFEKKTIAKKLLQSNMSIEFIITATGLTKKQIDGLR